MPKYPAMYFWKEEQSKTVHWHYLCDRVPVRVAEHPRWQRSHEPPDGRRGCPDCTLRDQLVTVV